MGKVGRESVFDLCISCKKRVLKYGDNDVVRGQGTQWRLRRLTIQCVLNLIIYYLIIDGFGSDFHNASCMLLREYQFIEPDYEHFDNCSYGDKLRSCPKSNLYF